MIALANLSTNTSTAFHEIGLALENYVYQQCNAHEIFSNTFKINIPSCHTFPVAIHE